MDRLKTISEHFSDILVSHTPTMTIIKLNREK
jgi:3-hydroxyisobutyryl-CoA hydrolase